MNAPRRILIPLLLTLAALLFLCSPVTAAPQAVLTSKASPRPGEELTLTLSVDAKQALGFSMNLSYNDAQLTLTDVESRLGEGWVVEHSDHRVLIYDNLQSTPIVGSTVLIDLVFRCTSTLEAGTEVQVEIADIISSDGDADTAYPNAVYTATVLPTRSDNAMLAVLTAEQTVLSPAFSPAVTEYQATVPHSITSLRLRVIPAEAGAVYKISGNSLRIGSNSVVIRVTAEDGSSRDYRIRVTRLQDPDYRPSSDATLRELTPDVGLLSPAFSPDRYRYVLYLPSEVTSVSLSGIPTHEGASCSRLQAELNEGENPLVLTVRAEDGSEASYTVLAIRMPVFGEEDDPVLPLPPTPPAVTEPIVTDPITTSPPDTVPQSDPPLSAPATEESEPTSTSPAPSPAAPDGVPLFVTLLLSVLGPTLGFLAALLWQRRK